MPGIIQSIIIKFTTLGQKRLAWAKRKVCSKISTPASWTYHCWPQPIWYWNLLPKLSPALQHLSYLFAVDKWISKGDVQLQPGSASRRLGLNDFPCWKCSSQICRVPWGEMRLCSGSLLKVPNRRRKPHGVIPGIVLFRTRSWTQWSSWVPFSSGILWLYSSTWFYEMKFQMARGKSCDSGTWEPCQKQVTLIPVSALILWATWMHSWLPCMYEINLLLWVGHSVETVLETSDSMQFSKSGVPVPLCSVQCQRLVIWFDFWMAQKDVSAKIRCKVIAAWIFSGCNCLGFISDHLTCYNVPGERLSEFSSA